LRAIAQNGTTRDSRAATAAPPVTGLLDERQVLFSTLPPSRAQKRLALAIVLMLLAAFCATLPFATPAGYIREFIPAYATAMFVNQFDHVRLAVRAIFRHPFARSACRVRRLCLDRLPEQIRERDGPRDGH
jgi:hypothetical protein